MTFSSPRKNDWVTEELLQDALAAKSITEEEGDWVRAVDVERRGLVQTAKDIGMPKATLSEKHTLAIAKLQKFAKERQLRAEKGDAAPIVFRMIRKGKKPPEIVEETGLEPEVVEKLYDDYFRLEAKDLSRPTVPKRLRDAEIAIASVNDHLKETDERIEELSAQLSELTRRFEDQPINNMYRDFKCPKCGSIGLAAIHFECTKCENKYWIGRVS